ncbi:transglutaminase family protein [Rhodococcus kroppenstedtii]|uniref:transglutaminase family protein n=1 Tax=Rhodococcoides kroppenstedtii TaxID=293050 RepID=UPI0029534667|nr:transglutaminase family protein [Rhodococcus kroppenstedtii]MDV7198734.1 transglutaminase family protein [Rhodococcus kroppenstedtii]
MSWRLRVVHTTGYNYDAPVTSSYNEARLTPRSDNRQNVILNRVETDPATRSYRYTDYWGTAVTAFDLHAPHTSLEVVGSSVVETDAFTPPAEPSEWGDLHADSVTDRFDELLGTSTYVPANRQLASVAKKLAKDRTPYEAVTAVAEWVHAEMAYVPGTTGVHTSAVEAYAEKKGVCQDYAHLTLLMLRSIGIPARYVSGYLHPTAEAVVGESVEGQSHAWVEAWTGSWWGYDPTNAVPVREQHVSVGIGRDYADVPPLKGIFSGGGSTELDVVVEITRLA